MSIKEHPPQPASPPGERFHVPVLLTHVLDTLRPIQGETYLDLTAGYGGHAAAISSKTDNPTGVTLVDRDAFAASQLQRLVRQGATLIETDFASAARRLVEDGRTFDMILADLGVSSPQLDQSERGFSFRLDGPLDMRMDQRQDLDASDIVRTYSAERLTDIIIKYGEEPRGVAQRIAGLIVHTRQSESITTTRQLADLVAHTIRGPRKKIHPATRTFQALRIEVNGELRQLETLLPLLPRLLTQGGRVAIISFHSLEDRLVKRYFAEQMAAGYEAELQILTKKPILGTDDVHNPRARSAKLRAAVKQ